jgi:hypothetical protein
MRAVESAAILTVLTSIVLMVISPTSLAYMPKGYQTPIVAFEFLKSPEELLKLFPIDDPSTAKVLDAMDLVNKVDFVFLVAYPSLLYFFAKQFGSKYAGIVKFICLVISLFDGLENWVLLQLTDLLRSRTVPSQELIDRLGIFTHIKWSLIGVVFIIISPVIQNSLKSSLGRLLSILVGSAIPLVTVIAYYYCYHYSLVYDEIYCGWVVIVFLLVGICTLINSFQSKPAQKPKMKQI